MSPDPTPRKKRQQASAERKRAVEAAAARQRRNRVLLWGGLAVVVVIAIVVAVVASGSSSNDASATKYETAAVTVDGTALPRYDATKSPDPAVGDTIPTLHGESVFDGTPVTVAPNGKPQAVVFVAHWCPHCQAEVPRLVKLAKDGAFDGIDVTAVATGTSDAAPNYPPSAWLERDKWPFAVMADSKSGTAAQAYGLSAYPYFVLVDADGHVAGRATGEIDPKVLATDLDALKAGKPLPVALSGVSSAS